MQHIYKSEGIPWSSGGKKTLPLAFVPRLGPRGGNLAIERIEIECAMSMTTGSGVSMTGADQATYLKKARVYDKKSNRRYLTGFKLLKQAQLDLRNRAPTLPSTLAASQTGLAKTFQHSISFKQPHAAKRKYDFLMPVDDLLDGGGVELEMPANSDLIATGGTPTIVSGTYTVYVICREEFDVEFHSRDVIEEAPSSVNSSIEIPVNGRLIRGIFLVKEAASGGTAVTTITDFTIGQPFDYTAIPLTRTKQAYLAEGPVDSSNDPVYNDLAAPLIFPKDEEKQTEHLRLGGNILIRLNSTLATPDAICHFVDRRDRDVMRSRAQRNALHPKSPLKVKTEGKSRRHPAQWGAYAGFLPVTAKKRSG